jgi:hypothetical protein
MKGVEEREKERAQNNSKAQKQNKNFSTQLLLFWRVVVSNF